MFLVLVSSHKPLRELQEQMSREGGNSEDVYAFIRVKPVEESDEKEEAGLCLNRNQ